MFCPNCGQEAEGVFCTNCGTPLQEAPVQPVAAPVAEPVAAPVAEPVAAPVVEPVAAPVVEPVAAPVVEPVAAPVVEPVAAPAPTYTPPAAPVRPAPQYQPQPTYVNVAPVTEDQLPDKYKPVSAWGYFGLQLLYSIPLIGFIFMIIYSFDNGNINRRNFTRSYWCALLIGVIIGIVTVVLFTVLGVGLFSAVESSTPYYY